ncbi:FAD-dependent oxidoreductase [Acaryochloris sp. 'Moss Beach']|uniref:FAD-dependent oxidoreductase n=1 Tax=Acaryochloris sp. 'Moss Beach' TaxID=2740837 RepID=UPI001F20B4A6|nr:FAD-dependent oxidoreductase [Acaryochloris sp. 'Moss Beach']
MRVGIIGCGVVGAAIAFELSQTHQVTVWDARGEHQWQATGAALGVLMAAITPKAQGETSPVTPGQSKALRNPHTRTGSYHSNILVL